MSNLQDTLITIIRGANPKLAGMPLDAELDFCTQGLDSLDHVQIIMAVEAAYGLRVEDDAFDDWNSVDRIADFLSAMGHGDRFGEGSLS